MINQLSVLVNSELSYALGWTIIHSLWQVSLIAMIMSVFHNLYKNKSPELRHNISVFSMITVLLSSIVTFLLYYGSSTVSDPAIVSTMDDVYGKSVNSLEEGILTPISQFFSNNIDHINLIWTIGVIVFSLRLILSYLYLKYLKNNVSPLKNNHLLRSIDKIKNSMGIKKTVSIGESNLITVPMVMGYFKPIILPSSGPMTKL